MWKWISGILLAVLIVTNGWWLYAALDQASTLKYKDLENYELRNHVSTLKFVANSAIEGISRSQAAELLRGVDPDFEPYEKEGHLNGIWMQFEIDDAGRVVKIK